MILQDGAQAGEMALLGADLRPVPRALARLYAKISALGVLRKETLSD